MSFIKEFKDFALRGNVLDIAVGIIIGAAFGKIVSSLVADIIMPPIGLIIGGVDFSELKIPLEPTQFGPKGEVVKEAVTINYGKFLQTVIDFLIIAFAIFALVKGISSLRKKHEATPEAAAAKSDEVVLLTEIRDLLKK